MKIHTYTVHNYPPIGWMMGIISMVLMACSEHTPYSRDLDRADSLLWCMPDASLRLLDQLDTAEMGEDGYMRWALLHEHARLKSRQTVNPDSILPAIIDYYESRIGSNDAIGEALYIRAAAWIMRGNHLAAISDLQHAAALLAHCPNWELRAIVYHKLGEVAEANRLYEQAVQYYHVGYDILSATERSQYTYYFLRDIARMYSALSDSIHAAPYYQSAEQIAMTSTDSTLIADIHYYQLFDGWVREQSVIAKNDSLLSLERYRLHHLGHSESAYTLASVYLYEHEYDSFQYYMHLWSADTVGNVNARHNYKELEAQYLYETQDYRQAYLQMKQLHNEQEESWHQRQLMENYRLAHEQQLMHARQQNLQLKIERQHILLMMYVIISLVLTGIAVVIGYYIHLRQERTQLLIANQQKEEFLVHQLNYRLSTTQAMREAGLRGEQIDAQIPVWLNDTRQQWLFTTPNNWHHFQEEFDAIHHHLLQRLHEEHPRLTDSDLQYIALSHLGFKTKDISILLDVTPATLWTRRQRIREHIQEDIKDLDQWIQSLG